MTFIIFSSVLKEIYCFSTHQIKKKYLRSDISKADITETRNEKPNSCKFPDIRNNQKRNETVFLLRHLPFLAGIIVFKQNCFFSGTSNLVLGCWSCNVFSTYPKFWKKTTQTRTIRRGVRNLPQTFHLYLIH